MSVDVEMALHDRLQMKPKEFDRYFTVDEATGNIVVAIRKGRRGRTVWLDRSVWTAVNRYVKDNAGEKEMNCPKCGWQMREGSHRK